MSNKLVENSFAKNIQANFSSTVIDFESVKNSMGGNEELMQEIMMMFLQALPEEIARLQFSYENEDWEMLKTVTHKLKGGASYCGTLQLNKICISLEEAICAGNTEMSASAYQQLLTEIEKVRTTIQNTFHKFVSR